MSNYLRFTSIVLASIAFTAEQTTIIIGIGFFFILISIFTAASTISMPTAILIPRNAFAAHVISRNLSKNFDIKKIMMNAGYLLRKASVFSRSSPQYPINKGSDPCACHISRSFRSRRCTLFCSPFPPRWRRWTAPPPSGNSASLQPRSIRQFTIVPASFFLKLPDPFYTIHTCDPAQTVILLFIRYTSHYIEIDKLCTRHFCCTDAT